MEIEIEMSSESDLEGSLTLPSIYGVLAYFIPCGASATTSACRMMVSFLTKPLDSSSTS